MRAKLQFAVVPYLHTAANTGAPTDDAALADADALTHLGQMPHLGALAVFCGVGHIGWSLHALHGHASPCALSR
jgi:hypothetical protein